MGRKRYNRRKNIFEELPFYTTTGIICAGVSLITVLVTIILASCSQGTLGLFSGLIGIIAFGISTFGLCMNIKGIYLEENMYMTFPLIGVGVNGGIMFFLMVLYIVGLG